MSHRKLTDEQIEELATRKLQLSWTYRQLADHFGISAKGARDNYMLWLKSQNPNVSVLDERLAAVQYYDMWEQRIQSSYAGLYAKAKRDAEREVQDTGEAPIVFVEPLDLQRLITSWTRMARERSLLLGLDAPKQIQIEGTASDPFMAEVERAIGQMDEWSKTDPEIIRMREFMAAEGESNLPGIV